MNTNVNLKEQSQIVISKDAPFLLVSMARRFSEFLGIPYVRDDAPEQEKEILLGSTNRPQTIKVRPDTCRVFCRDGKVVFAGVHYQPICERIEKMILSGEDTLCIDGKSDTTTSVPLTWGEYQLVWNDEFDGKEIDLDRWIGNANMGMPDVVLSMKPGTVDLEDSALVMTASVIDYDNPKARYKTNYSVMTGTTMNFVYGYMEIRAKVPHLHKGEWPSFWFLSGDAKIGRDAYKAQTGVDFYDEDDYTVEVDMFENFSQTGQVASALHKWGKGWHSSVGFESEKRGLDGSKDANAFRGKDYYFCADEDPNDWHTYGLLWKPTEIAFLVDGIVRSSYDLSYDFGTNGSGMKGFHRPLTVLFNNMLFSLGYVSTPGGAWFRTGEVTDHSIFPLRYEIDYCRLYQASDNGSQLFTPAESGKGKPVAWGVDRRDHGEYYSDGAEPQAQN